MSVNMYTIDKYTAMRKKKRLSEKTNNAFQLRLSAEELARYIEVLKRAEGRQSRAQEADVNRILLGLDPPDNKLVTANDILFFRGQHLRDNGTSEVPERTVILPFVEGGKRKSPERKSKP